MVTSLFEAQRVLTLPSADVLAALAYLQGDVWQGGDAWVGPRLSTGDPASAAYDAEVKRALVSANLIRDLVGRHVASVVGREPAWELPIPEADSEALTVWWDKTILAQPSDVDPLVGFGVLGMALARAVAGEVPVFRLRVRSQGRAGTLSDALGRIAVDLVPQAEATVLDLDEGPYGVVTYDANARTLAAKLGTAVTLPVAELASLNPAGNTLVRIIGYATEEDRSDPLPLGGRLTHYAMRTTSLVTPALLGVQRRMTATLTGMGRNTDTAAFAEVTYFNADRPGAWVNDPTAPDGRRFEPEPLTLGPGYRLWLRGLETENGGYTQPGMNVREPSSPATFTQTGDYLVTTAYREAKQLHALISGDATASGESRKQAMADFTASLGASQQAVEAATRWLLETAYALALVLTGRRIGSEVRATVQCQLSGIVPTSEELAETRTGANEGYLARARYQRMAGVDDTEAEDALIVGQG